MLKFTNRLRAPLIVALVAVVALAVGACQTADTGTVFGTVDGFGSELSDSSALSAKVRRALRNSPDTAANKILVSQVGEDTVKLSGFVRDSATSFEAERVAGQVDGVRHVFNDLIVQ